MVVSIKVYKEFHGDILPSEIGRKLRDIVKQNKNFKIMTGYGSTTGVSESKKRALTSLRKMKKEGLITDYFPGDIKDQILSPNSSFYETKLKYESQVRKDRDYGNPGIIFIYIK